MPILSEIREKMNIHNIDGLLITNPLNRRYVSGFTGSAGTILITESKAIFMTDFRYEKQANSEIKDFEIVIFKQSSYMQETINKMINDLEIKKLAIESDDMTHQMFSVLNESVSADLIPKTSFIAEFRSIKNSAEIRKIKKAAEITDNAFEEIYKIIKPGISELKVANNLEFILKKLGSDMNSRTMTVASGIRSALPHGRPSTKIIENNDMVTLDFGAVYQGYHSDMTRTIILGDPGEELKRIYKIVLDALNYCKENIRVGMKGKEVDYLVRGFIEESGYGKYFGHGSGHGIGLALHEDPFFSTTSNSELLEGMVITIEPGIYLPDVGGVRVEDNVIINNTMHEVITNSPREIEV